MSTTESSAGDHHTLGVEVVEVGPRDGLQNERTVLSPTVRASLVSRLVDAGLRRIEAVSFVREDLVPQMADAEAVMSLVPRHDTVSYIGLVLNRKGAERAVAAGCDELNVVVPATDAFSMKNQNRTVQHMLDQAATAADVATNAGVSITVTIAVAFGCPFSGPVSMDDVARLTEQVLAIGVDEIAYADTIGVGVPAQVVAFGALLAGDERAPNVRFHFHNTRNTGYANAYAATLLHLPGHAGVTLDASVGGFGGCPFAPAATGNIATEDLMYQLRNSGTPMVGTGHAGDRVPIDIEALVSTGRWLGEQLDSRPSGLLLRAGDYKLTGAA